MKKQPEVLQNMLFTKTKAMTCVMLDSADAEY